MNQNPQFLKKYRTDLLLKLFESSKKKINRNFIYVYYCKFDEY